MSSAQCGAVNDNIALVPLQERPSQEVETQFLRTGRTFPLTEGAEIRDLTIAYETYGTLNAARDNAVLLFHAFSGSQHAAGVNSHVPGLSVEWNDSLHDGWWDEFIGPGKALDTDALFVVCANILGGCYGTTGPSTVVPDGGVCELYEGRRYGSEFPWINARDVVRSQALLLDELGIDSLRAVVGPSLGGIMALAFALEYPGRAKAVVPIATSHVMNARQIAENFHQQQAIVLDPDFRSGDYYGGPGPLKGLVLARQIAQMTFVDQSTLIERAGTQMVNPVNHPSYRMFYPVESYLRNNAANFVNRFDANSYLVMLGLWQGAKFLDLYQAQSFPELFARCRESRFTVIGIDPDDCFPTPQQAELNHALREGGVDSELVIVTSRKGHDSFLVEPGLYERVLRDSLAA
jgi:homoserine O-acetyltransferase